MNSYKATFAGALGAAFMCLILLGSSLRGADATDLTGTVVREGDVPVAKASVFIATAAPRQGTSSLCPSCYPDCIKKATTGADGKFKIGGLDATLLFRVLVVAGGYQSQFVSKVDPAHGELRVQLGKLDEAELKSASRILGAVIRENGEPVIGAVIEPEGVQTGSSTRWGGIEEYVEAASVTDDHGHFFLRCLRKSPPVDTVHATVSGPGIARQWVALSAGKDHLIRTTPGVDVNGRVLLDGKPLSGVVVGIVTTDRMCGNFLRCDQLATGADGRFLVPNVPPDRELLLYTSMESLQGRGSVKNSVFRTGKPGTRKDLGDLTVGPAYRVAGRIVLADGKNVPSGPKLFLGREQAWDHAEVPLGPDGGFEFVGVPPDSITLNVRVKGYVFSKRNPSLDRLNQMIVGRVDRDIGDLMLLMEPGERDFNSPDADVEAMGDVNSQPKDRLLRGVSGLSAALLKAE